MDGQARASAWDDERTPTTEAEFDAFFRGVAQARYVLRRASRIVDHCARDHDLDPLEHQLLLQLFAVAGRRSTVSRMSERLDVNPAVGARLSLRLEARGLVERRRSPVDRRVTEVVLTEGGRQRCVAVCLDVRAEQVALGDGFTPAERRAALDAFAYYVGTAFRYDSSGDRLLG